MTYYWDASVARYRDELGRFVSEQTIYEWRTQSIKATFEFSDSLASRVFNGSITPATWNAEMRELIKREYIRQGLVGYGGRDQMDPTKWGSLGGQLSNQYRYLDRFTAQIAAGELSEGQIRARARMYFESAKQALERGKWDAKKKAGYAMVGWNVNPMAESCGTCLEFEGMGLQPIEDDPFGGCFPGSGCSECLSNCQCSLYYVKEQG